MKSNLHEFELIILCTDRRCENISDLHSVIMIFIVILTLYFSEMYMVHDKSFDFEETWSFLDKRLVDINTMIHAKSSVSMSC